MRLNNRRIEFVLQVLTTSAVVVISTTLTLVCLSGTHDPSLWLSAVCSFALLCGLLFLQWPVPAYIHALYGLFGLCTVAWWFIFDQENSY
jgi:hypothetical protein